ncbi:MAG: hypothetical protein IPJ30_12475 [Acidobacteria bacterium]|nr:hypothetical protein [Acidobacteriota bacterium]
MNKTLIAATTFLIIVGLSNATYSQTEPTPTPDPEIQRRKDKAAASTAEAEARQKAAEARKQEIENRKNELENLKGTTTVTGDLIEKDIAAFRAASCAAGAITRTIDVSKVSAIVIFDQPTADALNEYSALIQHNGLIFQAFKEGFKDADVKLKATEKAGGPVTNISAAAILGPALDILALFKVDDKITGAKVTIERDDFVSMISTKLGVQVYDPIRLVNLGEPSALLKSLNDLLVESRRASEMLKRISDRRAELLKGNQEALAETVKSKQKAVADLEEKLKKANARTKPAIQKQLAVAKLELAAAEKAAKDDLAAAKKQVEEFDADFANIIKDLNRLKSLAEAAIGQFEPSKGAEDDAPKGRSLVSYLRAEQVLAIINKDDNDDTKQVAWLDARVAQAGGNVREKGSPIIDIFTRGKSITFSGGAVVSYRLVGMDGLVLASNTIMSYAPYSKLKKDADYDCRSWVLVKAP